MLSSPLLAVKPAIGMITSDGSGGNRFSRNMSSAILKYPICSMSRVIQSVMGGLQADAALQGALWVT